MQIGSLTLSNKTVLAPLAGITNLPFRLLAKAAGCGLVCSEMISANGLVYQSSKTEQMLDTAPEEKPLSVQIFGSDPDILAEAAAIVESKGADIVDINFGCSVRKVVKTGSGVALMKNPNRAKALLTAVRKTIHIPLTIKIRSGWDASGWEACNIARIAQDCGVDAIAVHPRTAGQLFRGRADWSIIAAVKKKVEISVIGNGDVTSACDALKMFEETGCDAVMIGRKAIGDPSIFTRVLARLNGAEPAREDLNHRFDMMNQYFRASVEYIGEEKACRMMRSRLGWFTRGMRNSSKFRESIKHLSSMEEGLELLRNYRNSLLKKINFS
ncbi:MAG: tRNA dihydrouridine synthase DusB [Desulfobacterales bacterium]